MRAAGPAAALLLIACVLLATPAAGAELTQQGDLFLSFDGGLAPHALPRSEPVPIALSVEARVRTLSGKRPPALRRIEISLAEGGRIDTAGLALCRRAQIRASSAATARARCGAALIGGGSYAAETAFPEQPTFTSRGRILAFNSRLGGSRAILAHLSSTGGAPLSRLLSFRLSSAGAPLGTELSASLPPSLNRHGYLTRIALRLRRTYTYRGRRHSYLSAACAAPPGISVALFPFARATLRFADGRSLSSLLTRSCRVDERR